MLLIPEILDAIDLRVLRLEGVHRPRVSTTRGKKEPPAATTWASWRMSFEASAASAAAPALTYIYIYKSTVTFQPLTVHKVIIWIELVSNYMSCYPLQLKANLH